MIAPFWKTIELLEKKQNSLLTTIAVCSLCAAIMLTVGVYKGEARAAAATSGEAQIVTTLKPITQLDDTGYRMFANARPGAGNPDWELRYAASRAVDLRKLLRTTLHDRNASHADLDAADVEFVATLEQLNELVVVLEEKLYLEQEASSKESKDAISKDVGGSG